MPVKKNSWINRRTTVIVRCGDCNFQTNTETGLSLHVKYNHSRRIKLFSHACTKCTDRFKTEKEMLNHKQKHEIRYRKH